MPYPAGLRRLDFPEPFGYQSGAMPPFPAFAHEALPGRVVFGVGPVEQLGEEVDRLGARRVLAVAGKRAIDGEVTPIYGLTGPEGKRTGRDPRVLPRTVAFVRPEARPQLARLAGALGVEEAAGGIWDLGRRLGAPVSLAELALAEAELDRAATQAVAKVVQAPRRAGVTELRALLDAAWQGRRPPPT
jgi:alcohol dehydrogenase class IV